MDPACLTLKLLLVGDSAVGKSSLLRRFTDGAFEPGLKPTIETSAKTRDGVQHAFEAGSPANGPFSTAA